MTTPSIEELIAAFTQTNQLHEDADICTADIINVLQSQAERIKVLESECLNSDIRLATVIEQREKLRAQRAKELEVKVQQLKTVPMKYRRMEFNAQLQKENETLRAQVDELGKDAERLDWLEKNLFHRENVDWITGKLSESQNMWVTFTPVGVQGAARTIIDAAIDAQKGKV